MSETEHHDDAMPPGRMTIRHTIEVDGERHYLTFDFATDGTLAPTYYGATLKAVEAIIDYLNDKGIRAKYI